MYSMKFESRLGPVMRRDLGGSADRAALLRSTPPASRWLLILPWVFTSLSLHQYLLDSCLWFLICLDLSSSSENPHCKRKRVAMICLKLSDHAYLNSVHRRNHWITDANKRLMYCCKQLLYAVSYRWVTGEGPNGVPLPSPCCASLVLWGSFFLSWWLSKLDA